MRAFIALELSPKVKKKIAEVIEELRKVQSPTSKIKWVEEENLHITLKFLGNIEEKELEKLKKEVSSTAKETQAFTARFKGIGMFNNRVIFVDTVEGREEMKALAKLIDPEAKREFMPHITIGRIKERRGLDKLKEKIKEYSDAEFGETLIDHISIMESKLSPKGPIYKEVLTCPMEKTRL